MQERDGPEYGQGEQERRLATAIPCGLKPVSDLQVALFVAGNLIKRQDVAPAIRVLNRDTLVLFVNLVQA